MDNDILLESFFLLLSLFDHLLYAQGIMMLEGMDDVTIFLNGPAVEYEKSDSEQFPLQTLAKTFSLSEGILLA